jgi:hypothetical protein
MGTLDDLKGKTVIVDGVSYPDRKTLKFSGASFTGVDVPAENATEVQVSLAGTGVSAGTSSSIQLSDGLGAFTSDAGLTYAGGYITSLFATSEGGFIDHNVATELSVTMVRATGASGVRIQPICSDGTSDANVSMFRNTATSGAVWFRVLDGSVSGATVMHELAAYAGADSTLCNTSGNLNVGSGSNAAELILHNGARVLTGTGTPEGAVTGSVGDIFTRDDGGAGTTLYIKESGAATNTGWVGK